MVSDILTAIIILLMAILVLYPASRMLWRSWQSWHKRQAAENDVMRRR